MTKVVLPSFASPDFKPFEMRQLVSALELRFQSLESATQQSVIDRGDVFADSEDFAPLVHTHTESDITDLNHVSSIFNMDDVSGSPSVADVLIWNGSQFLPGAQAGGGGGATILNDLTDVSIPSVSNDDVLQYNSGTAQWEPVTGDSIHPTHIGEVTGDISLSLDVSAITNQVDVVADAADDVAIHDDSDGLIKKVNLSSITDAGYF